MEALIKIQSELKAPKNQYNSFGKYKYRNCEDILEALKPLLLKHNCKLTITDEIKEINGILFVEATAQISEINGDKEDGCFVKAQAGIDVNRKGMDIAQSFGASSSYARKYALNGLFLIDDTKDADATNTHGKEEKETPKAKATESTVKAMLEAIKQGKKSEVEKRMVNYEFTDIQLQTLKMALNGL